MEEFRPDAGVGAPGDNTLAERGTVPTLGHAAAWPTVPFLPTILRMVVRRKIGTVPNVLSPEL
jgi:hypothetical protein